MDEPTVEEARQAVIDAMEHHTAQDMAVVGRRQAAVDALIAAARAESAERERALFRWAANVSARDGMTARRTGTCDQPLEPWTDGPCQWDADGFTVRCSCCADDTARSEVQDDSCPLLHHPYVEPKRCPVHPEQTEAR